ncbi:hypothetical protein Tter_0468 [Thermobaculum terrenum ATCC BAA-798]|uniref:Uncharacterized protein n=1 Tax=Thermobaculum terrenum (strain ATCC BAA-798 / CCMEE 7001 / YNP1) TaxID=525904 RepID=D1CEN3_THET1|nr:hypothetical protein Tter_0468 [Thermobaculum terrenum ATCC BAA-798]
MFKVIAAITPLIIGILLVQTAFANNYGVSLHKSATWNPLETAL